MCKYIALLVLMKNYFKKQMTGWIWPVGIVCRPYPAALGNNQSLLSQVVGPDLGPWTDICVSAEIMKACGQCFSFSVFDTLLAEKLCWNSVQFSSVTQLCPALCNPMNRSTPGLPVHHELPEFNQTHVHWVGDASKHLILCHHLLLLPPILPSIRVFSDESAFHIRWPKYWSFSFSISPSNEHQRLISFRMDWLGLLVVQGTLKSLLQNHSSKASTLMPLAFFIVKLSHPYMTTGKTIVLTRQTFVDKVMALLFNMLSRLVITFLTRTKCLLISWLQSPSAVILESRKIKSAIVSTVSPSIRHEVMGPDAMILVFWMLSFKPTFPLSSFTFIKRLFSSSSFSAIRVVSSAYLRLLIFRPAILIQSMLLPAQRFLWSTLHIN